MFMSPGLYDAVSAENTAAFLVIPNLGSIPQSADGSAPNRREERRALALNQVAGVLTDAKLIRALSDSELSYARKESKQKARTRLDGQEADNVGLIAKAHRALEMSEWSAGASDDPEIFRLVDADGLLPLLTILSERDEPVQSDNGNGQTTPPPAANTNA